jgi:succinoglycan biosynthesis transport protein ExoP
MEDKKKSQEIDLMDYWQIILRRRWIAIIFASAILIFTGIFTFLATPQYRSTTTILIEEESSKILNIEEALGFQPRFVQDLRSYNTQLKLLKSKSLAERVARKLNLAPRPEVGDEIKSKSSLLAGIKYIISFRWLSAKKSSNDNSANATPPPSPYSEIAENLAGAIEVSTVADTKLVELSFISPSPVFATDIVNTLAGEFINFSIEKRFSTTQQAADFLTEQISNLRDDISAKERELQRYGQEKDIAFLSDTDTAAVSTFSNLSEAYNQAMLERINAEAEYRELKNLGSDSVPQLISDPAIQQSKNEYIRLRTEYEEKSRQFKPDHPEMIRIRARLESLKEEINKVADSAEAKYKAALNKEASVRATLEKQRTDVSKMRNNGILYSSIKSEIDSRRKLLNTLLEKQSVTQLSVQLRGLETSNISIIDRAEVPKYPISPNKRRNFIMAILIAFFGGAGLCFLFEYLDDTLKGPEEVERLVGLPSLGVIPYLPPEGLSKSKQYGSYGADKHPYRRKTPEDEHSVPEIKEIELVNHLHPDLPLSEDYRTIRTSILLSHAEKPPKTIVVSSCMPQEGKTATMANLAVSFAQLQERVLVIDTDLRKPRLHRLFKIRNVQGLTSYLTGKALLKEVINKTFIENVWLVPSGPIPPNPAELLNSMKMKDMIDEVRQVFDLVILDSPPILAVIDTVIISSIVDASVIVVRSGRTRRKQFLNAVNELRRGRGNIIGVIFNGVDLRKGESYYSKQYRYYGYGTYGKEEEESL